MRFLAAILVFLAGAALSAPVLMPPPLNLPFVLKKDAEAVSTVCFSPNGKTLASSSWGGTIRFWDVATGSVTFTLSDPSTQLRCLAFSPDGKTLAASANGGKRINLVDVETGDYRTTLEGHLAEVESLAYSPDGKMLASGSMDGTVRVWDVKTGKEQATLGRLNKEVISWLEKLSKQHGAFGPRGKVSRPFSIVRSWDAVCVSFSPDGKTLAWKSHGRINLWDVKTGKELAPFHSKTGWSSCIAYSPDGESLASGSGVVKLWDVKTRKEKATLTGHKKPVWVVSSDDRTERTLAFSPDGKTLATGGDDNTIIVWDLKTGKELATLKGHKGAVFSVAFSPDGKLLASGSQDRTIILWDVKAGSTEFGR